ncbi:hypothetical protein H4582DRAFT_2068414 [Lactarius indigo]|nr:hypothetical protein H4582DRAFT_2068414 [Lactarius indigo]
MGPTLPLPAPLPVIQQQPFIPPPPSFQPSHAGAYPVPGGNGQYHAAGMDVNIPIYAQPYGVQLYGVQLYGMHPYGAPLAYPPFHPHFPSYPGAGNAQPQPWGYGHCNAVTASARLELDEGDFGDFSWSRPEAYGTKRREEK